MGSRISKHITYHNNYPVQLVSAVPLTRYGISTRVLIQRQPIKQTDNTFTSDVVASDFSTKEECEVAEKTHEDQLIKSKNLIKGNTVSNKLTKLRRPTLYGYLAPGKIPEVPTIPQGPHVVAKSYIDRTAWFPEKNKKQTDDEYLSSLKSSIDDLYRNQVMTPQDIDAYTAAYRAKASNSKVGKLDTAKRDYEIHGNFVRNILHQEKPTKQHLAYAYDRIRRMMDMDPYATYRWSTQGATKNDLDGKAEASARSFSAMNDEGWAADPMIVDKAMYKSLKTKAKLSGESFSISKGYSEKIANLQLAGQEDWKKAVKRRREKGLANPDFFDSDGEYISDESTSKKRKLAT